METLRILIAEDHPLFRKGMISLLSSVPEFEVVGEAKTGEEAVERASDLQPDVVLMDLQMPEVNGIEATRRILQENPYRPHSDGNAIRRRRLGIYGLEGRSTRVRPQRCRRGGDGALDPGGKVRGEAIFSPAIATRVLAFFAASPPGGTLPQVFPTLTDREREIRHLIAQGHPNPSIAWQLSLILKTVGTFASNIFTKLQVSDRAQAIIRARDARAWGRARRNRLQPPGFRHQRTRCSLLRLAFTRSRRNSR